MRLLTRTDEYELAVGFPALQLPVGFRSLMQWEALPDRYAERSLDDPVLEGTEFAGGITCALEGVAVDFTNGRRKRRELRNDALGQVGRA